MKYYGIKKVESTRKENESLVVNKKENKESSFVDVFLVQMCICLMIICAISVTRLFVNPTESVFLLKHTLLLNQIEKVEEVNTYGNKVEIKYVDEKAVSLFNGKIEDIKDNELIIKVKDNTKVKFVNMDNISVKVGEEITAGKIIGSVKEKIAYFNILQDDKMVGDIRIKDNRLEW